MIKASVKFMDYNDFYKRCCAIKLEYKIMPRCDKEKYKYYIYSRRFLSEYTCDLIWDYLNDNCSENGCVILKDLQLEKSKYKGR